MWMSACLNTTFTVLQVTFILLISFMIALWFHVQFNQSGYKVFPNEDKTFDLQLSSQVLLPLDHLLWGIDS